jgi:hypothetical protein
MKKYLIAALILIVFSQCQKIEKIENAGDITPKIVANCILTDSSYFFINVTKSLSALDNAPIKPIKTAKVEVFDSKGNSEILIYNPAVLAYEGTQMRAIQGEKYKVVISAKGFETVTMEAEMPKEVKINSIKFKIQGLTRQYFNNGSTNDYYINFQSGKLSITFNDDPNRDNYYILSLEEYWEGSNGQRLGNIMWDCKFPGVETTFDPYRGDGYQYYFKDGIFNGKTVQLDFTTPEGSYNYAGNSTDSLIGYFVKLNHVSADLSQHWLTVDKAKMSGSNPFEEPVQIYSNVKNGYGILGGKTQSSAYISFR